jgi:alkaline phosphatase D
VVLWTRVVADPLAPDGGLPARAVSVRYELATDEQFRRIIRRGALAARPDEAHSVHVELEGLTPGSEYFYRFSTGGDVSPIGRTRTAPAAGAAVPRLDFAFVSCQNWSDGYFTSYADVVDQDLDLVIHLGDYIYEGSGNVVRMHLPRVEIRTLDDYRVRHAQYKTDADLQAAHAAYPWLVTWDDHEVENNYADGDGDPDVPPEEFAARRAAAYQAYWEHMPLRRASKPRGPDMDLFRRFRWGSLATFNVLDTRQYRSDQPEPCERSERIDGYCPSQLDPSLTMLGDRQRAWLYEELATTTSTWNLLANQTAFAPFDRDGNDSRREFLTGDSWDGYPLERQALIDWMVERRTRNPVVLTGDAHLNRVRNVPPNSQDFDVAPVASELMGTSVSTNGDPPAPSSVFTGDADNPHIVFRNNQRGYVRCTAEAGALTSDFRVVSTVEAPQATASSAAVYVIQDGRPGAQLAWAPPAV